MKICILVPTEEHTRQAGVRIRYRRIEHILQGRGDELQVVPIQELAKQRDFEHDVYVVSKCYDARAFLVARLLKDRAKLCGIDLFDDYFSQTTDSRFSSQRYWLRTLLTSVDFVLCSTPAMREVASSYAAHLPVHVMNDPTVRIDLQDLCRSLRGKLEYAHRKKALNIGWFGMGDNPHFPVGLSDVVAFGRDLQKVRGHGFDVSLTILTNERALTPHMLSALRRLPVAYALEEWTEEREKELLARSVACFLPVNAQAFSVRKSLNRALTALSAGVQVLSSGYPLYEPLGPFIYRDPLQFLEDVKARQLTLRDDTAQHFLRLVAQWGDPASEAGALAEFLGHRLAAKSAAATTATEPLPLAVIHGRSTLTEVHKLAQRWGALSVCSPFCSAGLNFDVRLPFVPGGIGFDVLIADKHCASLPAHIRALLSMHGKVLDTSYQKLDPSRLADDIRFDGSALGRLASPMSVPAGYAPVMANVIRTMQHLFPGVQCYVAEQASLPWTMLSQRDAIETEFA
jgi:hypothetical protein